MNNHWLSFGLLFTAALAIRAAFMPADPTPKPGSDDDEYDSYAWNLAQGRGYRGPSPAYSDREHLTSWRMPGPSLLFAAVYKFVGHKPGAAIFTNAVLGAATCVVIYFIGLAMYGPVVGWLAAIVYAFWPHAIFYSRAICSEPLFVFLYSLLVLHSFTLAKRPSGGHVALSGLLLGAMLYTRPHPLILPAMAVWIVIVFWRRWPVMLKAWGLFFVAGLMMLPWVVRNYRVQGAFVPFTTQAGEALLLGNNRIVATDPRYYGYSFPPDARLLPEYKHEFDGLNEMERQQRCRELYQEWMRENRDKLWYLTHSKFRRFWTPLLYQDNRVRKIVFFVTWTPVLTLFVVPFFATLASYLRAQDGRLMVHAAVLSTLAGSLIVASTVRYRFVIEGFCIVFACAAVVWIWNRLRGRPTAST